MNKHSKLRT